MTSLWFLWWPNQTVLFGIEHQERMEDKMARVESKSTCKSNLGRGVHCEVTLEDGRTGKGDHGGFFQGRTHEAETRAIQDANSKPLPKNR